MLFCENTLLFLQIYVVQGTSFIFKRIGIYDDGFVVHIFVKYFSKLYI